MFSFTVLVAQTDTTEQLRAVSRTIFNLRQLSSSTEVKVQTANNRCNNADNQLDAKITVY